MRKLECGLRPIGACACGPGGNSKRKDMVHRAQGIGLKPSAGCQVPDEFDLLFEIFSLLKPETLGSLQHVVRQNPITA